jgi:hypothetical protein
MDVCNSDVFQGLMKVGYTSRKQASEKLSAAIENAQTIHRGVFKTTILFQIR